MSSTAAAIMGIAGLASAGVSAGAGLAAAGTQSSTAMSVAQMQEQEQQQALQFQEQQWNTQQTEAAPFLQAGQGAVTTLAGLLGPNGSLNAPNPAGTFEAPTAAQAQAQPGYQFGLQAGQTALQSSAAANGSLFSGGTAKALNNYAQGYADTNYQNVYQNALNTYQTQFNAFNTGQNNTYNRLAGLAGIGQQTSAQLGNQGVSTGNSISNTLLGGGQIIGQNLNNAAAATASGYASLGNSLGNATNNLGQSYLLSQLLGLNNPATAAVGNPAAGSVSPDLSSVGY